MSQRELVVLGSASQTPTRHRNHNGYLLRFDAEGVLFDPGEGTQRQMILAGRSATEITRICVTHFHGDHSLGLAGTIQRLSLDNVPHPVRCYYPASGQVYFDRLRHATSFHERATLVTVPLQVDGPVDALLSVAALDHRIDCYGYRLAEPDGRRMLPDRLAHFGIRGPQVSQLQRDGVIEIDGRRVTVDEVSVFRPGQVFAFVMDTRMCPGALTLAQGADLLVAESTFLDADRELAHMYRHLTSREAGRLAAEAGARELVLTHFSQRYPYDEAERFREEAALEFKGEIHVAADLTTIPFPRRR
ncbi:ribonuclease Z [Kutzneria sp. CA-103260]|uniref:ribonuclease Z n=1 Tax=Kutzneria sp. CA-103260 TaxID=2802641 RepID=UPI001BA9266D|nr:ribonuclease Z [Kutzneria sp. CA-103260]QUQ62349.1 ribonuclease Z [Kutzneria sp. CA-103260]